MKKIFIYVCILCVGVAAEIFIIRQSAEKAYLDGFQDGVLTTVLVMELNRKMPRLELPPIKIAPDTSRGTQHL